MLGFLKNLTRFGKAKLAKISFACTHGGYYVSSPVELARNLAPYWLKEQYRLAKEAAKAGKKGSVVVKFVRCPGMHDFVQQGYIISAPFDIHIKANKLAVNVHCPNAGLPNLQAQPMDYELVKGWAPMDAGVKGNVWKIPLPWGVHMPPGYSCHVLPAYAHANWMDKLFSYPGTVDYDDFHTINFIFTVMKECEYVIPQGTPLLHILPFKREDFHGYSGPGTQLQRDRHTFGFVSRVAGAYRRKFHKKKVYTIEVEK